MDVLLHRSMKWQRVIWIAVAPLAIAIALVICLRGRPADDQPRCEGKSLTDWAGIYIRETGADPSSLRLLLRRSKTPVELSSQAKEARRAIRLMGTNALPWILKHLAYEPPPWKARVNDIVERFTSDGDSEGSVVFGFEKEQAQVQAALMTLEILGPDAAAAIPELRCLAASTNASPWARPALRGLIGAGREGLASLLSVVMNDNAVLRREAAIYLGVAFRGDTNALPAVPVLLTYLTNRASLSAQWAAAALGNLALAPELVVPALTNCLTASDEHLRRVAARALFRLGPAGRAALPALAATPDNGDLLFRAARAKWMREVGNSRQSPESGEVPEMGPYVTTLEPDGAASGSQPVRSETNRTS